MDFERVDSFPEFNLFFSPNWYSHQIADISPSGLCALGCNDEVQLIDLYARRPITSLYIKTPQNDKFINDINERKVTAVLVTDKFIVFSTVSGYLTIFEISNNNIICKFCDNVLNNVQISCIKELKPEECELELLLTDNKNKIIFAKYKNGMIDQLNLERQGNNHSTKCLEIINYKDNEQFYAKIMDNGSFNLWTAYFEEAVFNVDIGHILNTASFGIFDGLLIISMITRKNRILVCQVGLEKILDDFVKERKFIHTSGSNFRLLVNLELEVETPYLPASSLNKIKLRFHNRIVGMNDQRLVITSKDGNMYLTDIESLMKIKEDKIVMRPAAYEDSENPFYEMLDENPHFKNIYFSRVIGDTFIAIGMDRLVSFWRINKDRVQYDFNIKCLGSKVTKVAVSSLEPQSFLLASNDNTMRLWNTGKKANRFVTTILWKGLDKKQIKEMVFHPKEESIVALTSEKEISMMDIHAHTIISQFVIAELHEGDIAFAQWLPRTSVDIFIDSKFDYEIQKMLKTKPQYKQFINDKKSNTKLNSKFIHVNPKYQKQINPDYLYVSYVQNKGFIIADFKIGTVFCINNNIEKFVASVEILNMLEQNKTLFAMFGDKKGNMFVIRCRGGKYDFVFLKEVHTALITTIKARTHPDFKDSILVATGSYDKSIKVLKIKKSSSKTFANESFEELLVFKLKFRVNDIDWDPFNPYRFLNTCQKHVTVQIWNIKPEVEEKEDLQYKKKSDDEIDVKDNSHYVANIRGHKGFITHSMWSRYEPDHIITCSDDQSVKIWNLINIKSKKPPSKKKKDTNVGEVIIERDEEGFEDDFEGKEYYNTDKFREFTTKSKPKEEYTQVKDRDVTEDKTFETPVKLPE